MAALLVILGGIGVAYWIDATAISVDRDRLSRGADAVRANVDEQLRILELAVTGTDSLVGKHLDDTDLVNIVSAIDTSSLASILSVVSYPVTEEGTGDGGHVIDEVMPTSFGVPPIDVSRAEVADLLASGDAFLSEPVVISDAGRNDYILGRATEKEGRLELIGVLFRLDSVLQTAVDLAGEGEYSVAVRDLRQDSRAVIAYGDPVGTLQAVRSPSDFHGALDFVVRPSAGFPFSQSSWTVGVVVGTGVLIALLLVWMARMVRARARELEERLRLAQELSESKDRFLATVSHELRTPLTVVLGVAAEVGSDWENLPPGDRADLLAMMNEQANEASNIVEDLLVAARSDPSQLRLAIETTELRSHIEYALASLPQEAQPRIKRSGHRQLVEADSTRLRQIIRNLLENAVRYGGERVEIQSWREEDTVWLTVSDNGVALRKRDLERIFEPYERSNSSETESPTGVGIGLYVSRMLARLMGGELDCYRPSGQTVFRLRLPAAETATSLPRRSFVAH